MLRPRDGPVKAADMPRTISSAPARPTANTHKTRIELQRAHHFKGAAMQTNHKDHQEHERKDEGRPAFLALRGFRNPSCSHGEIGKWHKLDCRTARPLVKCPPRRIPVSDPRHSRR